MKRPITLSVGVLLTIAGAAAAMLAFRLAIEPPIDAEDVAYISRLTMIVTAGSAVALLSGVGTILSSFRA